MSEEKVSLKNKIQKLFAKFKILKKVEIIIAAILFCIIIVIFVFNGKTKGTDNVDESSLSTESTSTQDYATSVELRLSNVLSLIEGAGNVKVFVSVNATPELVIAEEIEEKVQTNSSGTTTTTTKTPVLVKDGSKTSTITLMEKAPEICGILVVAEGANDAKVKLKILSAIKALFDLDSTKIEVIGA